MHGNIQSIWEYKIQRHVCNVLINQVAFVFLVLIIPSPSYRDLMEKRGPVPVIPMMVPLTLLTRGCLMPAGVPECQ